MISIHALLAESDPRHNANCSCHSISIHALLAESDTLIWDVIAVITISIHALLAESDNQPGKSNKPAGKFLSTLSLRRATHQE